MTLLAMFFIPLGFFCALALLVYAVNEVIRFEIDAYKQWRSRSHWG